MIQFNQWSTCSNVTRTSSNFPHIISIGAHSSCPSHLPGKPANLHGFLPPKSSTNPTGKPPTNAPSTQHHVSEAGALTWFRMGIVRAQRFCHSPMCITSTIVIADVVADDIVFVDGAGLIRLLRKVLSLTLLLLFQPLVWLVWCRRLVPMTSSMVLLCQL